ncbi:MAG: PH domain-containing protein [Proteobacteria bacterium]|nr:PH domain-containing protein [Pseudomonadota bacterium]
MYEYMNSTNDKLTQDEAVFYRAKCHWAVLLGPVLVIIIGGLALRSQGYHAIVLIVFGLFWGIFSYIRLSRTEIGLTRNKVLINAGFLLNKSYDIELNEIIFIDYYQPSLGSMLNFGKIMIVYKGKKKCTLRFVSCPAEFVREVQQQIIALSTS